MYRIGMVTNRPTPGFLANTTAPPQPVWAHSSGCSSEDHSRVLWASTDCLPVDWRRPTGRPHQSWLRTIDSDLKPLNLGLHSALRRASIVLPSDASWKRLCSSSVPPDDDEYDVSRLILEVNDITLHLLTFNHLSHHCLTSSITLCKQCESSTHVIHL